MSGYRLRDNILNALNSVYTRDFQGDWYRAQARSRQAVDDGYALSVNLQLTTDIMAHYAFVHSYPDEFKDTQNYYEQNMFRHIHNMIWTCWPGGSTAETAARKVCEVLNVPIDDE